MVKGGRVTSIYEKRPWLKNYPEGVPHDIEIHNATAIGDFMASADQKPDAPAVHYFDETLTYGDIDRLSNSFAAALEHLGVVKGDRVILVLQNVPQFLISTYAAWKIGAIVVPLNPMYKEKELSYFCENSDAKIFITLEEIASQLEISFLKKTSIEKVITTSPLDFLSDQMNLPKLIDNSQKKPVAGCLDMLELTDRYQGAKL
nr:AMP-binding protein [Candidatus Saccharibacteria bacterium]